MKTRQKLTQPLLPNTFLFQKYILKQKTGNLEPFGREKKKKTNSPQHIIHLKLILIMGQEYLIEFLKKKNHTFYQSFNFII